MQQEDAVRRQSTPCRSIGMTTKVPIQRATKDETFKELCNDFNIDRKVYKRYCDNIPIDSRRVVTVRTSSDGRTWTNDWGCLDKHQKSEHCKTFNTSAIVGGDADKGGDDPPDLEFYREPQR